MDRGPGRGLRQDAAERGRASVIDLADDLPAELAPDEIHAGKLRLARHGQVTGVRDVAGGTGDRTGSIPRRPAALRGRRPAALRGRRPAALRGRRPAALRGRRPTVLDAAPPGGSLPARARRRCATAAARSVPFLGGGVPGAPRLRWPGVLRGAGLRVCGISRTWDAAEGTPRFP